MLTAQPELLRMILRLLFNLSFNVILRGAMMVEGLPQKLSPLLSNWNF